MTWECKVCNKANDDGIKECVDCGAANWDLLYQNLGNPEDQPETTSEESTSETETVAEEIIEETEDVVEEEVPQEEISVPLQDNNSDNEENIWEKLYDDFKNKGTTAEKTEQDSPNEEIEETQVEQVIEEEVQEEEVTIQDETMEITEPEETATENIVEEAVENKVEEEPISQPDEPVPSKEKIKVSRTNELLDESEEPKNIYNEQAAKLIRSQKSSKKPLIISVISILLLAAVTATVLKVINKPAKMALMEKATQTIVQPVKDSGITSKIEEIPDTLTVANRMVYKETMDFCLDLINSNTFHYYIKTNVLSENDLTTINDLNETVSGKPTDDQYNRLQNIYNKLVEKDVYYYHFAKFMLQKKKFQMAKNNIKTLKSKFPQSKLIIKANQLLEQTKVKSSE